MMLTRALAAATSRRLIDDVEKKCSFGDMVFHGISRPDLVAGLPSRIAEQRPA